LTAKSAGIDGLAIAEYPGPVGIHDADAIARNVATQLIAKIVAGLTQSSEYDDRLAGPRARDQREIVFTGTPDAVTQFFHAREWTDRLPIIAPTIERVEAYVAHSGRLADEEIAVLPSANLRATPWNIAVNAVMAGCLPVHMPLLIAAVQALGDERCSLNNIGSSSGIFPYVLINGPIVNELGIESGAQLVSRGPNPAIGRALGLIVINIAGFVPGAGYMESSPCRPCILIRNSAERRIPSPSV